MNAIAKMEPIKRQNSLSINTVEGWNDMLRVGHSRFLIERGIAPTEENLEKFQLEVNALAEALQKKYPPEILPVTPIKKEMIIWNQ